MIVIPAIDIEGGCVVHGADADRDPIADAMALREAGASWLHVVDMDRAFQRGENDDVVRRMAALDGVRVQLGGGVTDPSHVHEALAWGAARVVIGLELLLRDVALPVKALGVNLDLRGGRVWPRGASHPAELEARAVVERAASLGVPVVVCRDLDRDGALTGADLAGAAALVGCGVAIIVAGGVAHLDELAHARDAGIAGVIVGRALHAGRFRVEEALAWSA